MNTITNSENIAAVLSAIELAFGRSEALAFAKSLINDIEPTQPTEEPQADAQIDGFQVRYCDPQKANWRTLKPGSVLRRTKDNLEAVVLEVERGKVTLSKSFVNYRRENTNAVSLHRSSGWLYVGEAVQP